MTAPVWVGAVACSCCCCCQCRQCAELHPARLLQSAQCAQRKQHTRLPPLPAPHAQLFLAGVLAEGAGAAAAADAMLGALGEVQGVLDANVNATGEGRAKLAGAGGCRRCARRC